MTSIRYHEEAREEFLHEVSLSPRSGKNQATGKRADSEGPSSVAIHHLVGLHVGMFQEAGVNLHQARLEFLFVGGKVIPRGQRIRARGQLAVAWNPAHCLLALEGLFAVHVPARVELAFVFIGPFAVDLASAGHAPRPASSP